MSDWELGVCVTVHRYYNDVNNQQDATTFSFINLFKSAQHVSDDKFAHPQEHFLTIYSFWYNALPLLPRQQRPCVVPKTVYTVKKCSCGWANLSPETCWADLKRLIDENVVASCWLFPSLSDWET